MFLRKLINLKNHKWSSKKDRRIIVKIKCRYLGIFIMLFIVEIYIGVFVHDNIIRPFVGDVLVVCVIYFFIRSFIKKSRFLAVYIFIFACLIEVGQYFNLVSLLHMENFKVAKIIIGSTFDLNDIFCYFVGTILILLYEVISGKIKNNSI